MIYQEYKPCPQLSAYVECYWSAKADQPPFNEQESLIPDGTIELMFNFGDNYSQVIDDQEKLIKGSHIIGIRKQSLFISQTSKQDFFSIRYSGKYNSLAEIAYASGYYDQSHFIRQFKKLTSATPRQFLEQQLTIVKVIQPALAKRLSNSYNFS